MKIAINVSLNNDVNFRVFETLASGALLITDKINNNGLEDLFEDGKHLVTYSSASDLTEKIRYYLTHEEERKKIAAAGKELVDRMFRHHHIMRKVVDRMYELTGKPKPTDDSLRQAAVDKRCWCGGSTCQTENPLYVQCVECGTQVLTKNYTEEELKKFYGAEAYWRDRQVQVFNFPPIEERANNDFNDRIPVWFEVLDHYKKQPKRLLEIGCAHGGFLYYCRERGAEQVCGVEVDQGTCDFAKKRFNLPHVMAGLFPDVPLPFETFDAITGFDVIEHFLDPVGGLRAVAEKLSDDGICFFQTPCYRGEGGDWVQYKPAEHTFLYTEKGIRKLFDQVGLEIVEILPGYFKDDMFVIGRKKRARVVFVRPDAIGDNVLATGMLKPIAEKYGTKVSVVCSELVKPIYENHPYVEEVIGFDRERVPGDPEYAHQLSEKLAKLNASVTLHSVYSREVLGDWLSYATNAPERIGFRGNLSNIGEDRRDRNNQYYTQIIESDALELPEPMRHQEFLRALGVNTTVLKSDIVLTEEEHRFAADFFKVNRLDSEKTIVLGAQAAHTIKNYPFWRDALSDLAQQGWYILALGAARDAEVVDELLSGTRWRAMNLCGKVSLRQSAALISRSRLVASVDTSIAHIACAMNVPNVVILGGGHFGRFFPYASTTSVVCLPLDCYRCDWHCKFGQGNTYCINKVSAAVVAEAIKETLRTTSAKPRMFVQREITFNEPVESKPSTVPVTHFLDSERVEVIMVDGEKALSQRWDAPKTNDAGSLNVLR